MNPKNESINVLPAEEPAKVPVFMDSFLAGGHLVCALVGAPINLAIILFIVFCRRLRRQPRNIIWIGIGFSNIFVLLMNTLEISLFYSPGDKELCHIKFFLNGLPGTTLLMNNFFSLVERYLAIFHLLWYRRWVTVRLVCGVQLAAFILLLFFMKCHFIFGLAEVKCTVAHPLDRTIYFFFIIFFLALCFFGQLTLYKMIKKHLEVTSTNDDQNTNGGMNTTTNSGGTATATSNIQQEVPITASPLPERNGKSDIAPEEPIDALQEDINQTQNYQFVRIRNQMVSRLELEATRNVMLNVGLLLLIASTWITSTGLTLICQAYTISTNKYLDEEQKSKVIVEQCSPYHWAISYTRFILLIAHSIYQSICYVIRSKDFFTDQNKRISIDAMNARGLEDHPQER